MDVGSFLQGGGAVLLVALIGLLGNARKNRAETDNQSADADSKRVQAADTLWQRLNAELESQAKRHQQEIDNLHDRLHKSEKAEERCQKRCSALEARLTEAGL